MIFAFISREISLSPQLRLKLWACLMQQSASVIMLSVWQGQSWCRPVLHGKDLVIQTVSLWVRVFSCCQSDRDRVDTDQLYTVKTWRFRPLVCECECCHAAVWPGQSWDRKDLVVQTVSRLWVRVLPCCQSNRNRVFETAKTWWLRRLVCECEYSHAVSLTGTEVRQTSSTR